MIYTHSWSGYEDRYEDGYSLYYHDITDGVSFWKKITCIFI